MFDGLGGSIQKVHPNLSTMDPTLDACCQREVESNRKNHALQMTLAKYDRIALAERRRKYVFTTFSFGNGCRCCYDPTLDGGEYKALIETRFQLKEQGVIEEEEENQPTTTQHSMQSPLLKVYKKEEEEEDDDDEYDYLLEETNIHQDIDIQKMEQERKAEIYLQALTLESANNHGFGKHVQIHPQYLLRATGLNNNNNKSKSTMTLTLNIVLHLFEETSLFSATLDLILEKMAYKYKGTKFIRCNGRQTFLWNPTPTLVTTLFPISSTTKKNHTTTFTTLDVIQTYVPCLFAIQNGQVISSTCYHLDTSCLGRNDDGMDPSSVENWLYHTGVLYQEYIGSLEDFCRYRPEEEALFKTHCGNNNNNKQRQDEEEEYGEGENNKIYNCGILGCQKNFFHEHIGLKTEEQDGLLIREDEMI